MATGWLRQVGWRTRAGPIQCRLLIRPWIWTAVGGHLLAKLAVDPELDPYRRAQAGDARGPDRLAEIAAEPAVYYTAARNASLLLHELGDDRGRELLYQAVTNGISSVSTMPAAIDLATVGDPRGVAQRSLTVG